MRNDTKRFHHHHHCLLLHFTEHTRLWLERPNYNFIHCNYQLSRASSRTMDEILIGQDGWPDSGIEQGDHFEKFYSC